MMFRGRLKYSLASQPGGLLNCWHMECGLILLLLLAGNREGGQTELQKPAATLMQPQDSPAKSHAGTGSIQQLQAWSHQQVSDLQARMDSLSVQLQTDKQDLLGCLEAQQKHQAKQDTAKIAEQQQQQQQWFQQMCQKEVASLRIQLEDALCKQQHRQLKDCQAECLQAAEQAVGSRCSEFAELQERVQGLVTACTSAAEQAAEQAVSWRFAEVTSLQQQQLEKCRASCSQSIQDGIQKIGEASHAAVSEDLKVASAHSQQQALLMEQRCEITAREAAEEAVRAALDQQQQDALALQEDCRQEATAATEAWLEQALKPTVEALQEAWQQSLERTAAEVRGACQQDATDLMEAQHASSKRSNETSQQMQTQLDAASASIEQRCLEQTHALIQEAMQLQNRPDHSQRSVDAAGPHVAVVPEAMTASPISSQRAPVIEGASEDRQAMSTDHAAVDSNGSSNSPIALHLQVAASSVDLEQMRADVEAIREQLCELRSQKQKQPEGLDDASEPPMESLLAEVN